MKDEYILKLKLREGAFNIAQALSNQTSKAAKEKLQEARAEQRDLLEDLCDIEDELETKLGVFKVHINGGFLKCSLCLGCFYAALDSSYSLVKTSPRMVYLELYF